MELEKALQLGDKLAEYFVYYCCKEDSLTSFRDDLRRALYEMVGLALKVMFEEVTIDQQELQELKELVEQAEFTQTEVDSVFRFFTGSWSISLLQSRRK